MDVNAGIPDANAPTYGEGATPKGKHANPDLKTPGKPQYAVDITAFQQRWSALRTEGLSKWYPIWKDISRFILPKRGFFEGMLPNWGTRIDHKTVMSSAPMNAINTTASGMQSGLSNPAQPWFKLESENEDDNGDQGVREWFEKVVKLLMDAFQASNVYPALYTMYEECCAFGTHCFLVLPDPKTVIRCRVFTAGEYFIGCGPDGRPNALARQFWMTAQQLVKEFGYNNCSSQVQNEYRDNAVDCWHLVYHLIEENDDRLINFKDFRNMLYRSAYWEANVQGGTKIALALRGFEERPFVAPRWELLTTASAYGSGRGWHALGDVKQLYKMIKLYLMALAKVVDPPMVADAGAEVNTIPGGLSRSSANVQAGVKPAYQIQPDLPAMVQAIGALKNDIATTLYATFFLMLAQQEGAMTATEVAERHNEKMLMLGPVINRLQAEAHDPLIERTFAILMRGKALPPIPARLAGKKIRIKYVSMLAQAQEMASAAFIEQFMQFLGNVSAVNPAALDNVNFDELVQIYGQKYSIPAKILNNPDLVAQLHAARAKQQASAAQVQEMQAQAQMAQVLSQTKVGDGNALEALTGGGPGVGAPPPGGVA